MAIVSSTTGSVEDARATLVSMLGGDARPALSAAEVDSLLDRHRAIDPDGRRPTDDGWTGAWYLNRAAAEGWRMKAGKVAGDFSFSADGASFSKGEVLANCLQMEQHYAALDNGTVYLGGQPDSYDYKVEKLWP